MKRFDFQCDNCDRIEEHLADTNEEKIPCQVCGQIMRGLFPLVNIHGTLNFSLPYNHGLGKKFTSTKEMDNYIKRNKLVPLTEKDRVYRKPKPKELTKKEINSIINPKIEVR